MQGVSAAGERAVTSLAGSTLSLIATKIAEADAERREKQKRKIWAEFDNIKATVSAKAYKLAD